MAKDARDKRSHSVDSREEQNRADVCMTQWTWSPWLEVDGTPIPRNASIREFQRGRMGYIAKALEQPLYLPKDMEAYRRFKQNNLFLSLKRDLAMASNLHTYEFKCQVVLSLFLYFLTHVIFPLSLGRLLNKFSWVRSGFVTLAKSPRLRSRPSPVLMLRNHWEPSNRSRLRCLRSLKQWTRLAWVLRSV